MNDIQVNFLVDTRLFYTFNKLTIIVIWQHSETVNVDTYWNFVAVIGKLYFLSFSFTVMRLFPSSKLLNGFGAILNAVVFPRW